ncbi:MAG: gliding motility-associated C-terminal domain-containing protein, partial [Bacteroidota bacterium]
IICEASDRIELDNVIIPDLDLGPDTTLCNGELHLLTAVFDTLGQAFLERSYGDVAFDSIYISQPGRYDAYVETVCGTVFDRVDVAFENCRKVYLPDAFSPDGNGVNDTWFPHEAGDVTAIHRLTVFSRWGEQLYERFTLEPNRAELGWDGRHNGRDMPNGTYVWVLDASYRDGGRAVTQGSLQLVR